MHSPALNVRLARRLLPLFATGLALLPLAAPRIALAQTQPTTGLPTTTTNAPAPTGTVTTAPGSAPTLAIPIPDLTFSDITITERGTRRFIDVPWLAQYIAAVFRYGIGVAGLLASVMFMIGGFQYLTAGDSGRAAKGKKRIADALTGIILLLSTYTILRVVNPALVELSALSNIPTAARHEFTAEELEDYGDVDAPSGTTSTPGSTTTPGTAGSARAICRTVADCKKICDMPKDKRPKVAPGMLDPAQAVNIPTIPGLRGNGMQASRQTVEGLRRAAAFANEKGLTISVSSAYRPLATQIDIVCRRIGTAEESGIGSAVAWPGGSNHGTGAAVDIQLLDINKKTIVGSGSCALQASGGLGSVDNSRLFDEIMTNAGASRYSNEIWHYEFGSSVTACRCKFPNCPPPPRGCGGGC